MVNIFDKQQFLFPILEAGREAGRRIMALYGNTGVDLKADNSPVTEADRQADQVLVECLARLAPQIPIVSEESSPTAEAGPHGRFFLVDPLDGTKEFINERDEFTVNVALIEDGVPVFGMVYAPAISDLYITLSREDCGRARVDPRGTSSCSEIAIETVRARSVPASGPVAAVSRSHLDTQTEDFLAERGITDTHASGSSLKFCGIARGDADVYPRFGRTMEWDTAAGHAVLTSAGGSVTGVNGEPFIYGKLSQQYANPGFIAWGRKA